MADDGYSLRAFWSSSGKRGRDDDDEVQQEEQQEERQQQPPPRGKGPARKRRAGAKSAGEKGGA